MRPGANSATRSFVNLSRPATEVAASCGAPRRNTGQSPQGKATSVAYYRALKNAGKCATTSGCTELTPVPPEVVNLLRPATEVAAPCGAQRRNTGRSPQGKATSVALCRALKNARKQATASGCNAARMGTGLRRDRARHLPYQNPAHTVSTSKRNEEAFNSWRIQARSAGI